MELLMQRENYENNQNMNYKEKKRVQDREESEGEEGEITYIMLNLNSWKLCKQSFQRKLRVFVLYVCVLVSNLWSVTRVS